jgi:hypothetical protein
MRSVFIALLVIVSGCQGDPNVDFYTTAKPAKDDVVGRYVVTSQTVRPGGLALLWNRPGSIELRDDGTFTATNVPSRDSDAGDEEFFGRLVTCSGAWQLDVIGSIANAGGPPKQQWGVVCASEECEIDAVALIGSAAPFGLMMTFGDADAGRVIVFEREE